MSRYPDGDFSVTKVMDDHYVARIEMSCSASTAAEAAERLRIALVSLLEEWTTARRRTTRTKADPGPPVPYEPPLTEEDEALQAREEEVILGKVATRSLADVLASNDPPKLEP